MVELPLLFGQDFLPYLHDTPMKPISVSDNGLLCQLKVGFQAELDVAFIIVIVSVTGVGVTMEYLRRKRGSLGPP
jgi:hypothetical protein